MITDANSPVFSDLPGMIPVFPLSGVLLLPRGQLPLNIFEPRYKTMVNDALSSNRMIGMIQPRAADRGDMGLAALFDTGCAGRITSFTETTDGRYLITLTGLCRFRVVEELPRDRAYRRIRPDWKAFERDFEADDMLGLDRPLLKKMLGDYFTMHDLSCEWDAIDGATDARLVTCLAMICPFEPGEKQALLETPCPHERAHKFMSLLRMAVEHGGCGHGCH